MGDSKSLDLDEYTWIEGGEAGTSLPGKGIKTVGFVDGNESRGSRGRIRG